MARVQRRDAEREQQPDPARRPPPRGRGEQARRTNRGSRRARPRRGRGQTVPTSSAELDEHRQQEATSATMRPPSTAPTGVRVHLRAARDQGHAHGRPGCRHRRTRHRPPGCRPRGPEAPQTADLLVVVTDQRHDPATGQHRADQRDAVSSHGVRESVGRRLPSGTPWASSQPSAPTPSATVHDTVLLGLAEPHQQHRQRDDQQGQPGRRDTRQHGSPAQRPPLQRGGVGVVGGGGGRDRADSWLLRCVAGAGDARGGARRYGRQIAGFPARPGRPTTGPGCL